MIFIAHNIPNDKNHFFNTTYQHTDDMSHAITNLKAQHYKSAFKTLYAIFDKIAYFLNSFMNIMMLMQKYTSTTFLENLKVGDLNRTQN